MSKPCEAEISRSQPQEAPRALSVKEIVGWAVSGGADNVATNTMSVLAMPIYCIGLGVSPALIGLATGIPRIWDAFVDPFIGNLSDNTRSRWGRRRPYTAVGGALMSLLFIFLWMPPTGLAQRGIFLYFLMMSLAFYSSYAVWSIPTSALGLELTTDYHGRTRVQAYRTFFAMVGNFLLPWAYKLCFVFGGSHADSVPPEIHGVRYVGVLYGGFILIAALSPALFCRERSEGQQQERIRILPALLYTIKNKAFLYVAGILLLAILAVLLPLPLGQYINIYYVFAGNKEAASMLNAWGGTLNTIVNILGTPLVAWCGMHFGKRKTLLVSLSVCCAGSLSYWFTLTPAWPYLQLISLVVASPALLGAWILVPSMLADVCDIDELKTGLRREGMYGAVNAWVFKAGMGLTLASGGLLIQWTGVQPELAGAQTAEAILRMRILYPLVPAACVALALILILLCPLTEKKAREVRVELDRRRAAHGSQSPAC